MSLDCIDTYIDIHAYKNSYFDLSETVTILINIIKYHKHNTFNRPKKKLIRTYKNTYIFYYIVIVNFVKVVLILTLWI